MTNEYDQACKLLDVDRLRKFRELRARQLERAERAGEKESEELGRDRAREGGREGGRAVEMRAVKWRSHLRNESTNEEAKT